MSEAALGPDSIPGPSEASGSDSSPPPSPGSIPGISSLSHHCLLHAVYGIAPNGIHVVLPESGSHNIRSFCHQLSQVVSSTIKSKSHTFFEDLLVPKMTIHQFFAGVLSERDFTVELERAISSAGSESEIDFKKLYELSWTFYSHPLQSAISFPKWLSPSCTFRLWLIFNQCLDEWESCKMSLVTTNEILRRIVELCNYTWNARYAVTGEKMEEGGGGEKEGEKEGGGGEGMEGEVSFPQFLEYITDQFNSLDLDTSLTCEVILDLVDEIVHGVLKKGYLLKKGQRRRNWNRRWFVLQRTILLYYKSRDALQLKGKLVLNGETEVKAQSDKGNHRNLFMVTCGVTHRELITSADDQKMRHQWMLAIKKAIALARLTENGDSPAERKELESAISGFFLLKYGTNNPCLMRQDTEINKLKRFTSKKTFQTILEVSGATDNSSLPPSSLTDSASVLSSEDYVEMHPFREEDDSAEENYERIKTNGIFLSGSWSSSQGVISPLSPQRGQFSNFFRQSSNPETPVDRSGLASSSDEDSGEERYVISNFDPKSIAAPSSQKATPTHTSTTSPHPPPIEYLTILSSSSEAMPPPCEATPTHEETSPAAKVHLRRSSSPLPLRSNAWKEAAANKPPPPPPPLLPPRDLTTGYMSKRTPSIPQSATLDLTSSLPSPLPPSSSLPSSSSDTPLSEKREGVRPFLKSDTHSPGGQGAEFDSGGQGTELSSVVQGKQVNPGGKKKKKPPVLPRKKV